jgi:hypothetical protein
MNSRQRDNDRKVTVVSVMSVTGMFGYQADGPMYMYLGGGGVISLLKCCRKELSNTPCWCEFTQGHGL